MARSKRSRAMRLLPFLLVIASVFPMCSRDLVVMGPGRDWSTGRHAELRIGLTSESTCEIETGRCYVLDDEATGMSRLLPLLFMLWGCSVIAGTLVIAAVRVLRGSQHRLDYAFAGACVVAFLVLAFAGRVNDTNTRPLLPLWLMLAMPIALFVPWPKAHAKS
jgi:hypothetical protein